MSPDRLFHRSFVLLLLAQTVFGIGFSTFLLLPKFLATELQASAAHIGGITAAFGVASMLLMPVVGAWVDRFGRLRFALLGCWLMALTAAAFLLVDRVGPLAYALRFASGLANAFEFVAAGALVIDLVPPRRLGQALGFFGMTMLSTNALAPALAEGIALRWGWRPVFLLAAAASLAGGFLLLLLRETRERPRAGEHVPSLWQVAATPRAVWFTSIAVLMGSGFGAMFTFVQPLALELGRKNVSDFFVAYTVSAMAVRLVLGGLGDRFGRGRVAAVSTALYSVPIFLTALAQSSWLPWLGLALGLAHGTLFPSFNALVLEPVGEHERGKVFALFIAAFNAGWAGGSLALGFVAEMAGYRSVFVWAGLGVLAGLGLLLASREVRQPRERRLTAG